MKIFLERFLLAIIALVVAHQFVAAQESEVDTPEEASEEAQPIERDLFVDTVPDVKVPEEASEETRGPLPARMWAMRANIRQVRLSPSGKYLALVRTPPEEGNPVIEVFNTDDLSIAMRQNADPMEIQGYNWISDYTLIFSLRQKVRDDIEGFNRGVWEFRLRTVDVEEKKMSALGGPDTSIASVLPRDPDHVLIRTFTGGENASKGQAFRPESFWKYNLKSGKKRLVVRSKIDKRGMRFDPEGNALFASGFNRTRLANIHYWRKPGTKKWKEIYAVHRDSLESFGIQGLDPMNPNHLIVTASNGRDTVGLWVFDPETKEFVEPLYVHPKLDVFGALTHSNSWKYPQVITGLFYDEDTTHYEFFDAEEKAIHEQLKATVPNAGVLGINSRSMNGDSLVVFNRGPSDPGTYYLLHKGVLNAIGSGAPQISSEDLSHVEYITYTSRDGKTTIPAYVTHPKGEPPFPLIVMPHGGPWVAETIIYDPWSQMFANHGYMVIQPQYRGSLKYGQKFLLSSFEDGSQWGRAMQDDKDDGALYLVERGDVDPARMAMVGWSYGGYAALIAAARTPQIYQCVIAGAAVTDPVRQVNYFRNSVGPGRFRKMYGTQMEQAVSPVDEADKVNIPILLVHGEVDQRVPLEQADIYVKALKKHNKPYEYLLLEGADHFYSTLSYDHFNAYYSKALGFLKNDCGPGGI